MGWLIDGNVLPDAKALQIKKLNPALWKNKTADGTVRRAPIGATSDKAGYVKGAFSGLAPQGPMPGMDPGGIQSGSLSMIGAGPAPQVKVGMVAGPKVAIAAGAIRLAAKLPAVARWLGRPGLASTGGRIAQTIGKVGLIAGASAGLEAAAGEALRQLGAGADKSRALVPIGAGPDKSRALPASRVMPDWERGFQPPRRPIVARGGQSMMQVGQTLDLGHQVVKIWDTAPGPGVTGGGAFPVFAKMADGHIVARRLDGSLKHYRPYRPLVIGKRPSIATLARAERKINRIAKQFSKHLGKHVPRRKA